MVFIAPQLQNLGKPTVFRAPRLKSLCFPKVFMAPKQNNVGFPKVFGAPGLPGPAYLHLPGPPEAAETSCPGSPVVARIRLFAGDLASPASQWRGKLVLLTELIREAPLGLLWSAAQHKTLARL